MQMNKLKMIFWCKWFRNFVICNSLCSRTRHLSFPLVMEDDLELAEIENTQDIGKQDQELGEKGLDIDDSQGQVSDTLYICEN